jgi:hypothetical protein
MLSFVIKNTKSIVLDENCRCYETVKLNNITSILRLAKSKTTEFVLEPVLMPGRVIGQAVSRWFNTARSRFEPGSGHVGFLMDKVELGQVFSEYFGFHCQSSFQ